MTDDIIGKMSNIRAILNRYDDVLHEEVRQLDEEYRLPDPDALRSNFAKMRDESRLLKIGILGKVKAGKSSLLNGVIFEGKDILPKAATPMTASLAVIRYGDEFRARIEFFSRNDMEKIECAAKEYDELVAKRMSESREALLKKNPGLKEDTLNALALQEAKNRINSPSLEASSDQYRRMKESGLWNAFFDGPSSEDISSKNGKDFLGNLADYLGAEGSKMPFTRNVELFFPEESLKNLAIIDTPGLDDPVSSRSERTNAYLENCDVVLIVSPAGQFLSREDTNLMDRLTTRAGINEIHLIASQADTQLAAKSEVEASGGDFPAAYASIAKQLSSHAREHLKEIVKENQGTDGQFGSLTSRKGSQVLLTSAAAYGLLKNLEYPERWDPALRKAHELLLDNYPDYFEDREVAAHNLNLLAGVEGIRNIFEEARTRKEAILKDKLADATAAYERNIQKYLSEMLGLLKAKHLKLEGTDKDAFNNEREKLVKAKRSGSCAVDAAFQDSTDSFKANLRNSFENAKRKLVNETQGKIENAEFERQHTYTWTTGWWIFKKKHSRTETVTTIRAGAVRNYLNDLRLQLENSLAMEVERNCQEWKKATQKEVTSAIMKAIGDDADIDLVGLNVVKGAILQAINQIPIPRAEMGECKFRNSATGVLEGSDAEIFMDAAFEYLSDLRSRFQELSLGYMDDLGNALNGFQMSSAMFANMERKIQDLVRLVETRNASIKRLKDCEKELSDVW